MNFEHTKLVEKIGKLMVRELAFVCSLVVLALTLTTSPQAVGQTGDAVKKKGIGKGNEEKRQAVLRELEPIWKRAGELLHAGRLKDAEAAAKQAIARAITLTAPNRPPVARGYRILARAYQHMGRFPAAEQAARKALSISETALGPNEPAVGRSCSLLGLILTSQSRFREAEAFLNRALDILQRDPGPNHPDSAWVLLHFAQLRNEQGRHADAERFARRALAIFEKSPDERAAGVKGTLQWLGTITLSAARYGEAESYLKRALEIGEGTFGPQHWQVGVTLRRLGNLYVATERLAEAEAVLRRSVQNLEATVGVEHRATIIAMRALGVTLLSSGRTDEAESVLRKAVAAAEKSLGPDHGDTAFLLRVLGGTLQLHRRFAEAEQAYRRGLTISERLAGEGARLVGSFSFSLGSLYLAQGRNAEAKAMLERALAGAQRTLGPEHPGALNPLRLLADLDLGNDRPAEAMAKLKRVASVLDARRHESGGALAGQRYNNEIGPMLRRSTAASLATAAWQLGGSSNPSSAGHADDAFFAAQLTMQSTAAAAISQMATRFSVADDALGQVVRQGQDLLQRWQAIDQILTAEAGEISTDAKARQVLRAELERINKDLAEADRRLAAEFPQYAALSRPGSLKIAEVQKLAGADQVVLVFLVGDNESFVWAISQDSVSWQRLAVGRTALGEKVARLRKGLDIIQLQKGAAAGKAELFDLKLAHELYIELLGPVAHALEGKRHALVVPSGPLTSLPFHLLVTDPSANPITELKQIPDYSRASWIISRHAITMLPSVVSLKALRELTKRPAGSKPIVGYGDPTFGASKVTGEGTTPRKPAMSRPARVYTGYWKGRTIDLEALTHGLEPLPETADELRGVAKALAGSAQDIHLGQGASEAIVKETDLSQYRVVYFATHGLIAGEVSGLGEPALALATPAIATDLDDGLLTASEVAQLKLNADWVVLSACNTAAGDKVGAEAFSGLARAFFYAGARTLLVSHWSVDSPAAVRLTTKAFDLLRLEPGMTRAEALRQSMLSLMNDRSEPLNAYPAFWAPFALVGDGG